MNNLKKETSIVGEKEYYTIRIAGMNVVSLDTNGYSVTNNVVSRDAVVHAAGLASVGSEKRKPLKFGHMDGVDKVLEIIEHGTQAEIIAHREETTITHIQYTKEVRE